MRTATTCAKFSIVSKGLAAALTFMSFGTSTAQVAAPEECGANECFSPGFDVGILYPSPVGHYGITELMFAVEMGDLAKVELLLSSNVDVNARNYGGATALLMAAAYGNQGIVDRLLSAGADPNLASYDGEIPLASAIRRGHAEIAAALLSQGANPSKYYNANNPRSHVIPLTAAAVQGKTDIVRLLLDLGVDTPENRLRALNLALWKHHEDIVRMLLETDIDLNSPTYDTKEHTRMQTGELVLQTAVQQGSQRSTAMLLENGADVNGRNVHGESALYFAIQKNHTEIIELLLRAGASVVGDDLAAAFDMGDEVIVNRLASQIDVNTLEDSLIESLIIKADGVNNQPILDRLFAAWESRAKTEAITSLLFAKSNTEDCELVRWILSDDSQERVFTTPGQCEQKFFFNRQRSELYVLDDDHVIVISLDAPANAVQQITLPSAMIDENLATLGARVGASYNLSGVMQLKARVVHVGVLDSGDFAFVTHTYGPADETYGYLYASINNSWHLVRTEDCHRFEDCWFDDVLSDSLSERPSEMTVRSPEVRRNPYFIDKTETGVMDFERSNRRGTVTLNIDGRSSLLHYEVGESGHCAGDCVYTRGLTLELPDQSAIRIGGYSGNNAIVDRYALVSIPSSRASELIDLGTGKSVFGELQVAGWIH